MKNFICSGATLTMAAPAGGVVSGALVVLGSLFGIAAQSAPAGTDFDLVTEGVFSLPKKTGETPDIGAKVYWETATSSVTTTPTGNTLIGAHAGKAAALAGAATLLVKLNEAY